MSEESSDREETPPVDDYEEVDIPTDLESGKSRKVHQGRRGSMLRRTDDSRGDRLNRLLIKQQIESAIMRKSFGRFDSSDFPSIVSDDILERAKEDSYVNMLQEEVQAEMDTGENVPAKIRQINEMYKSLVTKTKVHYKFPLEVRMENFTFSVPVVEDAIKIKTVYNSSQLYPMFRYIKKKWKGEPIEKREKKWRNVLDGIDLVIKPGKMYLVLGPPEAGKSTLLKAISGRLFPGKHDVLDGKISYNGETLHKKKRDFFIENAFSYIDQLDKHAPLLTVDETFEFAYQCKAGGQVVASEFLDSEEAKAAAKKADEDRIRVSATLISMGLDEVRDTFVGDTEVRGVSGGQRRRVTVGEMLMGRIPVLCGDEISTGLDAASTFDMVQVLLHFGRNQKMTRVISLLQPSPETVSLFDEMIVLAEGKIIYAGPIEEVEDYFAGIGFVAPKFMDVADFVQMVSTKDGARLYSPPANSKATKPDAPTLDELAERFRESSQGSKIREELQEPHKYVWKADQEGAAPNAKVTGVAFSKDLHRKYHNSFWKNTNLNIRRFSLLWMRDKRVIIAGLVKNVLMGVSVGGVFKDVEDYVSIIGALFQAGLFIMLGAMSSATGLVSDRVVFYKHKQANFYSAWPFVFGRVLSGIPQTVLDVFTFGSILFFMVGLGDRQAKNFFIFIAILLTFAVMMDAQLTLFASFASPGQLQVYSSCILLLFILFGGFIVAPDAIPDYYYYWIYWWNPFAWAYRALVVNEFRSGEYEDQDPDADQILENLGFTKKDEPFAREWVAYSFAYMVPYFLLCVIGTALGLTYARNTDEVAVPEIKVNTTEETDGKDEDRIDLPFKRVNLSFQDICYDVKASTSKEKLQLLKNVNGIFRAGRMCALMGSSGAGKTTLMDVIALRKRTGNVTGDVRLNGWPQDKISFRRCSGYVEQFDVQTPELTVRETVLFSARMRVSDETIGSEEDREAFVDGIIRDVELTELKDFMVGTDEGLGLSFEQKKRLSIAVELAASPSVIFLDEPTSGLDARSALLVVKTLRKISDKDRTVCATIHQPSSAVFGMFDELLLLKKGGQVVFHGELGDNCSSLVRYFESMGAPKIELGDNPANWMLRVMAMEEMGDLAESYTESESYARLKEELDEIANATPDPELKIEYESQFANSSKKRRELVTNRLRRIYWRSPAYNLSRLSVSAVIAFVLGSVFVTNRNQPDFTETEMRSRLSVIFLTFIIVGIMAILAVLPVMTKIRDMYYRHYDASMYSSGALGWSLGSAEWPFIVIATSIFCVIFLAVSGLTNEESLIGGFIGFWGFFCFNFALYSYSGQLFVCLVKPMKTAMILCSVFIGLNNFMSGLIVRPQLMIGTFFAVTYYITPGHYVYEGLVISLFKGDNRTVFADENSEFYEYLVEIDKCENDTDCSGSVDQYIDSFFGGDFSNDHTLRNALILGLFLVVTRVATFLALRYIRYS